MENSSCLIYTNYLQPEVNAGLYKLAIDKKELYEHTKTVDHHGNGQINEKWRHSLTLPPPEFKVYRKALKDIIKANIATIAQQLGIEPFETGNIEMHLTSHNHGEFYKPHIDNGRGVLKDRVMTFVYYFHGIPKSFEGGQLLFLNNKPKPLIVEPANNSIVFFNSSLLHAVHPVSCPGQRFEDGRFTLNGWIWKKANEPKIAENTSPNNATQPVI
jgi:Rps23 Pro-64 3,4-dihydroxylase Tpa1-like proline 4-hydroxylase